MRTARSLLACAADPPPSEPTSSPPAYATLTIPHATAWDALSRSAESVRFVPKPSGGGVTVVYLEASDPERALGEPAVSEAPFETYYSGVMGKLLGFDVVRLPRAGSGELLFSWRDDDVRGEREAPNTS